ncbi:MAG: acyl-CoA dehydrogenase family protein [Streptosporangiales bacterium]|nr:acyl-CoA dehydrogenase family protein [Streptosporangiales bacterium]
MDFSKVALDDGQAAFAREVGEFFAARVTPDVLDAEERSGDGFCEPLHLAMGERGWLLDTWPETDGGAGLGPVEHRLLVLGKERTGLPFITLDTTRLVAEAVRRHAPEESRRRLMLDAARGTVRFCLGYTEPEGGSDVAAAATRAVRDGDGWVVDGAKMFTTGAHNCQYAFTITRTNPGVRKHKGLTMLLVPLDAPGVSVSPVRTFGGERTNIVYFGGVRVPDSLRIGPVDGGWGVLHDRLDVEHGLGADAAALALDPPSVRTGYATLLARCVDAVHEWSLGDDGRAVAADDLRYRLGRVAIEAEAALSAPGHYGRVAASRALIDGTARLMELLGQDVLLGAEGPAAVPLAERAHRFAQGTAIYGGTLEVFRNIIAEQDLKLPRPSYPA